MRLEESIVANAYLGIMPEAEHASLRLACQKPQNMAPVGHHSPAPEAL